jgi:hypothetical protein
MNDTLNAQHVKVLSKLIPEHYVDDFELIQRASGLKRTYQPVFYDEYFPPENNAHSFLDD